MRPIILMVLTGVIFACTPTLKPTVATNPLAYLDRFPLGAMTEAELIDQIGVPDDIMDSDGRRLLTYRLGEGRGKRQWVYEVLDGIVVNVKYYDQGPYSGANARKRRGLD